MCPAQTVWEKIDRADHENYVFFGLNQIENLSLMYFGVFELFTLTLFSEKSMAHTNNSHVSPPGERYDPRPCSCC